MFQQVKKSLRGTKKKGEKSDGADKQPKVAPVPRTPTPATIPAAAPRVPAGRVTIPPIPAFAEAASSASGVSYSGAFQPTPPQASNGAGIGQELQRNGYWPFAEPLPTFDMVPPQDKQGLFMRKLYLCSFTFDFNDMDKDAEHKETKRKTLLELVEYVSSGDGKFNEAVYEDVLHMVKKNIFRSFPPNPHETTGAAPGGDDEEEPLMEAAWPHLQLVYELLLRFIISKDTDPKAAKRYINQTFILKLLELINSEDPRERDYLKAIVHRIYGKFMSHRPFVRKSINNIFYHFIYETEKHNGIAELLEILGSIINGFALPLKQEHKTFLVRALIPLHKPRGVAGYHHQLSYCMTQFMEKDPALVRVILQGLLRFWPRVSSQKEVLFVTEVEEILEVAAPEEVGAVLHPLFQQVARCLSSLHFQVAERALFLWNNEAVATLILHHANEVLPIVIGALERNAENHWNESVHSLTLNVRKMFTDTDPALYEACLRNYLEEEAHNEELEADRQRAWWMLETQTGRGGGVGGGVGGMMIGGEGSGRHMPAVAGRGGVPTMAYQ